jgi:uncharacterized protein YndB with AHSA1/START domain
MPPKRSKITCEFVFRSSPAIVYQFIAEPDCLIRWFSDDCNILDDIYYFEWKGAQEAAFILEDIESEILKLQWEDYEDEFLEFTIHRSEVVSATILEISCFCDKGEEQSETRFWEIKIQDLKRAMGE